MFHKINPVSKQNFSWKSDDPHQICTKQFQKNLPSHFHCSTSDQNIRNQPISTKPSISSTLQADKSKHLFTLINILLLKENYLQNQKFFLDLETQRS